MAERVEITAQERALILEALDDAAYYRDTRSRVLESAVRKRGRSPSSLIPASDAEGGASDVHRLRAKAYQALAIKLRSFNM